MVTGKLSRNDGGNDGGKGLAGKKPSWNAQLVKCGKGNKRIGMCNQRKKGIFHPCHERRGLFVRSTNEEDFSSMPRMKRTFCPGEEQHATSFNSLCEEVDSRRLFGLVKNEDGLFGPA